MSFCSSVPLCLLLGVLLSPSDTKLESTPEVVINSGAIVGQKVGDAQKIGRYRGIPFAAPPVGPLRWKPPQPAASWSGTRECFEFGSICPQPSTALASLFPGFTVNLPQSEDCLTLNVWSPLERSAKPLPVMVWIHGGGMQRGSGAQPLYDGTHLAEHGVVAVTINYRLGPFGFLAHPLLSAEDPHKSSANYGILDQIAALQWVKRNIGPFGGDPNNVTIFGESAGGASVCVLMVSPLAEGLFHRAVIQSGPGLAVRHLRESRFNHEPAEAHGVSFIEERGGSFADVKAMRALSVDQLMKGADKNLARMDAGPIARLIPAVDGYVIPDEPAKLFAEGKFHRVPLMIGATRDEATMFLLQSRVNSPQLYREMVAQQTGDLADEFESIFPAGEKPLEVKNATNRFLSVTRFIGPMRYIAGQVSRFEPKVYYYHFTHVPANTLGQMMGSHHAAEIRYVFGNLSDDGKDPPGEKKLADVMMNCWIEFAKSGDPNGEHIPNWPTHSVTGDDCLEFGDTIKATQGLLKRECDAFDKLLHQELEEMESASSDSRVSESR